MINYEFNIFHSSADGNDNLLIKYAFGNTKFGKYLVGICNEEICYIKYCHDGQESAIKLDFMTSWPNAMYCEDNSVCSVLDEVFTNNNNNKVFKVLVKGTELQIKVWQELTKIPEGSTVTYEEIATRIGHKKAVRAVASAIAKNKISYLIPCHRVVHKSGICTKYSSGPELKLKILQHESLESKKKLE